MNTILERWWKALGGEGSGNIGHSGRPGHRGGSMPKGGGGTEVAQPVARKAAPRVEYKDMGYEAGKKVEAELDALDLKSLEWTTGPGSKQIAFLDDGSAVIVSVKSTHGTTTQYVSEDQFHQKKTFHVEAELRKPNGFFATKELYKSVVSGKAHTDPAKRAAAEQRAWKWAKKNIGVELNYTSVGGFG